MELYFQCFHNVSYKFPPSYWANNINLTTPNSKPSLINIRFSHSFGLCFSRETNALLLLRLNNSSIPFLYRDE
ncbi:hypothetical protein LWI29_006938 [Acer saccharum]|uniref:Uncharacterized protein n=1 Tax=Acer saccharum TaxID=4024 RepID=A0AA39VCW6_ACESA|nr:hypothetical protein LWI29_006938 [Acer saccharum]KAK1566548.1 hypothetical protein Q3G72_001281 [Acer saccharum]